MGMQVIGQYGDDYSVLYLAANFLTDFHDPNTLSRTQQTKVI